MICSLAAVLLVAAIPSAAEAASGSCAPRAGSIVARSGGAYIYEVDSAFYICSQKFSGRTKIADYEMDSFGRLSVRGRYAAFSHTYFNNGDTADTLEIEVVDLRRHLHSAGARVWDRTPKARRLCDYPTTSEFCYFTRVGKLLVTSHGSVAFGATLTDEDEWPEQSGDCEEECPDLPHHNVIYRLELDSKFKRLKRLALDEVKAKEFSTLRLAGPRMRWTGHGKHKSASIR